MSWVDANSHLATAEEKEGEVGKLSVEPADCTRLQGSPTPMGLAHDMSDEEDDALLIGQNPRPQVAFSCLTTPGVHSRMKAESDSFLIAARGVVGVREAEEWLDCRSTGLPEGQAAAVQRGGAGLASVSAQPSKGSCGLWLEQLLLGPLVLDAPLGSESSSMRPKRGSARGEVSSSGSGLLLRLLGTSPGCIKGLDGSTTADVMDIAL
ncbi:unnamed protein product [Arctogadus glacialis]